MFKNVLFIVLLVFSINLLSGDLSWNFNERIRYTAINNGITLSDKNDKDLAFSRVKTSIGLTYNYNKILTFNACLTNEFRNCFDDSDVPFSLNEVFFEKLNIKLNIKRFTFTIGRQNIMLGEGFIMFDGSPVDGSRSAYFNGLRGDYKYNNMKFTLFSVYQPSTDTYFPLFNDQNQVLIENKEKASGFYFNYQKNKSQLFDFYYINKKVKFEKNNINTLGLRFRTFIINSLTLTSEIGYQYGDFHNENHSALGMYSYLKWFVSDSVNLNVGFISLSGDDKDSLNKNEGWDSPFGRWPKWSELYIYTLIIENNGKVGYWSNLKSYYFQFNKTFKNKIEGNFSYYKLLANENSIETDFLSGDGKDRGQLISGKLIYSFKKNYSCHLIYEKFFPGIYYIKDSSNANFFRVEFSVKF